MSHHLSPCCSDIKVETWVSSLNALSSAPFPQNHQALLVTILNLLNLSTSLQTQYHGSLFKCLESSDSFLTNNLALFPQVISHITGKPSFTNTTVLMSLFCPKHFSGSHCLWIKSKSLLEAYKILKELVVLQFLSLSFSALYSISGHNKLLSVQKVQWELPLPLSSASLHRMFSLRRTTLLLCRLRLHVSANIHLHWKRSCSLLQSGEVPLCSHSTLELTRTTLRCKCLLPSHLSPSTTRLQQPGRMNTACCPPSAEHSAHHIADTQRIPAEME